MKNAQNEAANNRQRHRDSLANSKSTYRTSNLAPATGAVPLETLEKKMVEAARSEALSLAWLSGKPQTSFPAILELKVREARQYVRRQALIRGQSDRIIATAF